MVTFWNGNKSPARQKYEHDVLRLALSSTRGGDDISVDNTDYPSAEDEGNVFNSGVDILATIAGNKKFKGKRFFEVKAPICKGLLGWRLMIVARSRESEFSTLTFEQLKAKRVGVPDTWVDAELFRHNGFDVLEKGSLDEMLNWLADGVVDFITLGANEAHDILDQYPELKLKLAVEMTTSLYYPFPVVFYINPENLALAKAVEQGINRAKKEGTLDLLFQTYFGEVITAVDLNRRHVLSLENPLLPPEYNTLVELSR